MKNPDLSLDETYVLYGVRRDRRGFGHAVAEKLESKGYSFFLVHPAATQIGPWAPVASVRELPVTPDAAILCTPGEECRAILEQLLGAQVVRVYAAPGATNDLGRSYARDHGMNLYEECPLLHLPGLGFPHNLHRKVLSLFGR